MTAADSPLARQYATSANLEARQRIYRFRTEDQPWFPWVFDRLDLPPHARVLEVGCGNGKLWQENLGRIPPGWEVVLTDRSSGMLAEAARLPGEQRDRFRFGVMDIRRIAFGDETFDAIIANHMLYHVPERDAALAEVRRALKVGGRFFAAANAAAHLGGIKELMNEFAPPADERTDAFGLPRHAFTLDGGADELRRHFDDVSIHRLRGELAITDPQAIVEYILSIDRAREVVTGARLTELRERVSREIEARGAYVVATELGILQATR